MFCIRKFYSATYLYGAGLNGLFHFVSLFFIVIGTLELLSFLRRLPVIDMFVVPKAPACLYSNSHLSRCRFD